MLAGLAVVVLGSAIPPSASVAASHDRQPEEACAFEAAAPECSEQVRIAREATAKYRDSQVARQDGFVPDECVDSASEGQDPALGAMGEHWVRFDRMADQNVDLREPELLLYLETQGGRRLLGAEWSIVALQDGMPHYGTGPPDPARTTPPPRMFGRSFDGPMPGHNPIQPWHYDLHVALWERNPAGIFAQYNPRASCGSGLEGDRGEGGSQPPRQRARIRLSVRPSATRVGKRTRFRFRATTLQSGSRKAVRGAVVRFAGRRARTGRRGRATIVAGLRRPGRYRARAGKAGMRRGSAWVWALPRRGARNR